MPPRSVEEMIGVMREQLTQIPYGSLEYAHMTKSIESLQQHKDTMNRMFRLAREKFPNDKNPLLKYILYIFNSTPEENPMDALARNIGKLHDHVKADANMKVSDNAKIQTEDLFKKLGVK